jgi:hypothetical protein
MLERNIRVTFAQTSPGARHAGAPAIRAARVRARRRPIRALSSAAAMALETPYWLTGNFLHRRVSRHAVGFRAMAIVLALSVLAGCAMPRPTVPSAAPPRPSPTAPPAPARPLAPRSWRYDYDRNALAQTLVVGQHVLAITDAGHILRFDARTLALTGEKLSARRAVVMGPAPSGAVLVGLASGTIARIDPETLVLQPVTTVPGEPVWIGTAGTQRRTILVYGYREEIPHGWVPRAPKDHRVRVLETGDEVAVDSRPTTFFVDRHDRLWRRTNPFCPSGPSGR